MYADRYTRPEGIKPGSLSIAVALNAAMLAALLFSSPTVRKALPYKPFEATNIPVDPPPEPIPPTPQPKLQQPTRATPERVDTSSVTSPAASSDFTFPPFPPPPLPQTGEISGTPAQADPPAPPVFVGATADPRFARDFQPDYPAGERRAENEGKVVLRVLIGADGRVRQLERVSAASEAFWRATERQALTRWRFRPATRDGVAVETWQTMTVRFELTA